MNTDNRDHPNNATIECAAEILLGPSESRLPDLTVCQPQSPNCPRNLNTDSNFVLRLIFSDSYWQRLPKSALPMVEDRRHAACQTRPKPLPEAVTCNLVVPYGRHGRTVAGSLLVDPACRKFHRVAREFAGQSVKVTLVATAVDQEASALVRSS